MTPTQADSVAYVSALELPAPDLAPIGLEVSADAVEQALASDAHVNARSLVSFVEGVSVPVRTDVMNSLLLAQLAADRAAGGQENVDAWYDKYVEVLHNVGWTVGEFGRQRYEASGNTFEIDKVVLEILAAAIAGPQLAVVTAAIKALKSLGEDDRPMVIFDRQTHDARHGNFQVGAVAESDGIAVMEAGAFHFTTSEQITQILWFEFERQRTELFKGTDKLELNREIYQTVRDDVSTKLGDRAKSYVAAVELAPV